MQNNRIRERQIRIPFFHERRLIFLEGNEISSAADNADKRVQKDVENVDEAILMRQEESLQKKVRELVKANPEIMKRYDDVLRREKEKYEMYCETEEEETGLKLAESASDTIRSLEAFSAEAEKESIAETQVQAKGLSEKFGLGLSDDALSDYAKVYLETGKIFTFPQIEKQLREMKSRISGAKQHGIAMTAEKEQSMLSSSLGLLLYGKELQSILQKGKYDLDTLIFSAQILESERTNKQLEEEIQKISESQRSIQKEIEMLSGKVNELIKKNPGWFNNLLKDNPSIGSMLFNPATATLFPIYKILNEKVLKADLAPEIAADIGKIVEKERRSERFDEEIQSLQQKIQKNREGSFLLQHHVLLNSGASTEEMKTFYLSVFDELGENVPKELSQKIKSARGEIVADRDSSPFEKSLYSGDYSDALSAAIVDYSQTEMVNDIIQAFEAQESRPKIRLRSAPEERGTAIPVRKINTIAAMNAPENFVFVKKDEKGNIHIQPNGNIQVPVLLSGKPTLVSIPTEIVITPKQRASFDRKREGDQRNIMKAMSKNPRLALVGKAGADLQRKFLPLQQHFQAGIQGNKTESFITRAQGLARGVIDSQGSIMELRQNLSFVKRDLGQLKQMQKGLWSDEFERKIEEQTVALDQITSIIENGQIEEFCKTILNPAEFGVDDFQKWLITEGIIFASSILVAVGAIVTITTFWTGVGGVAGLAIIAAGGALGGMVGQELGTLASDAWGSAVYDNKEGGIDFSNRSLLGKWITGEKVLNPDTGKYEEIPLEELAKVYGQQFVINFITTFALLGLGKLAGNALSKFASANRVAGGLKGWGARMVDKLPKMNPHQIDMLTKKGLRKFVQRLGEEALEEFGEEGMESTAQRIHPLLGYIASVYNCLDGKRMEYGLGKYRLTAEGSVTTESDGRAVVTSNFRYDAAQQAEMEAEIRAQYSNEGFQVRIENGRIICSQEITTTTKNGPGTTFTNIMIFEATTEPISLRRLFQENRDEKGMSDIERTYGAKLASGNEYVFESHSPEGKITLSKYLKKNGFIIIGDPATGNFSARKGNEIAHFRSAANEETTVGADEDQSLHEPEPVTNLNPDAIRDPDGSDGREPQNAIPSSRDINARLNPDFKPYTPVSEKVDLGISWDSISPDAVRKTSRELVEALSLPDVPTGEPTRVNSPHSKTWVIPLSSIEIPNQNPEYPLLLDVGVNIIQESDSDGKTTITKFMNCSINSSKLPKGQSVAVYSFKIDGDTWEMPHRIVDDRFRAQGVGNELLSAVESVVQEVADQTGRRQSMTANTSQTGVLTLLLRSGFSPSTAADASRVSRVMSGDPVLTVVNGPSGFVWEERIGELKAEGLTDAQAETIFEKESQYPNWKYRKFRISDLEKLHAYLDVQGITGERRDMILELRKNFPNAEDGSFGISEYIVDTSEINPDAMWGNVDENTGKQAFMTRSFRMNFVKTIDPGTQGAELSSPRPEASVFGNDESVLSRGKTLSEPKAPSPEGTPDLGSSFQEKAYGTLFHANTVIRGRNILEGVYTKNFAQTEEMMEALRNSDENSEPVIIKHGGDEFVIVHNGYLYFGDVGNMGPANKFAPRIAGHEHGANMVDLFLGRFVEITKEHFVKGKEPNYEEFLMAVREAGQAIFHLSGLEFSSLGMEGTLAEYQESVARAQRFANVRTDKRSLTEDYGKELEKEVQEKPQEPKKKFALEGYLRFLEGKVSQAVIDTLSTSLPSLPPAERSHIEYLVGGRANLDYITKNLNSDDSEVRQEILEDVYSLLRRADPKIFPAESPLRVLIEERSAGVEPATLLDFQMARLRIPKDDMTQGRFRRLLSGPLEDGLHRAKEIKDGKLQDIDDAAIQKFEQGLGKEEKAKPGEGDVGSALRIIRQMRAMETIEDPTGEQKRKYQELAFDLQEIQFRESGSNANTRKYVNRNIREILRDLKVDVQEGSFRHIGRVSIDANNTGSVNGKIREGYETTDRYHRLLIERLQTAFPRDDGYAIVRVGGGEFEIYTFLHPIDGRKVNEILAQVNKEVAGSLQTEDGYEEAIIDSRARNGLRKYEKGRPEQRGGLLEYSVIGSFSHDVNPEESGRIIEQNFFLFLRSIGIHAKE